MPGMLGKKLGMTNVFNAEGDLVPVTIINADPCKIISIKTKEKDGYNAVQLGYGERKEKNISKPVLGQFKKNNLKPALALREFKGFDMNTLKVGDEIKVEMFTEGEKIKVRGKSKGKGFQGVMRRHGFSGVGGTTHGQSDRLRAPGSIGASSYPSRVFKGQRMAGRMGNQVVTISNLVVVKIIPQENIIMVKGAVPGAQNSIVELIKY
ncbi:MAG TPA: 50S ribosomal protein L3 [Ignavibacteriaceae bacterium]|nr:50S ribosomal protein L3 [Ignavibacteriaceae bacterium]